MKNAVYLQFNIFNIQYSSSNGDGNMKNTNVHAYSDWESKQHITQALACDNRDKRISVWRG
jgi:hypothetical protein